MAEERVESTHASNGRKQKVDYILEGEVVGTRWFDQEGLMGSETPFKNGLIHGRCTTLTIAWTELCG
jgi:hypothetical protein